MYRQILVALDGSEIAKFAFQHALHLAKAEDAEILAIYVVEYPSTYYTAAFFDVTPFHTAMVSEANSVLADAEAKMAKAGVRGRVKMLDNGAFCETIAQQIQRCAEDSGVGLVVMGTHGRRGFQRAMLGSVAESFVRLATQPVMLIPHKASRSKAA